MIQEEAQLCFIALRIFQEICPGEYLSADDLHKKLLENGYQCNTKTARKIFNSIYFDFKSSSKTVVDLLVIKRGVKKIPTQHIAILSEKKKG